MVRINMDTIIVILTMRFCLLTFFFTLRSPLGNLKMVFQLYHTSKVDGCILKAELKFP